jgi:hypothetical protein
MSLSQRELDLIEKIGECMDEYRQLLDDDGLEVFLTPQGGARKRLTAKEGDLNEFSSAVHIMQRMVMARAAQRNHPDFFLRRPAPVVDSPA